MNVRDLIKKARQTAKTPDEVLLPERFEEYLDLLEMHSQVSEKELVELKPRLKESLLSLREVAERVARTYGMDPNLLIEQFTNPQNIGMELKKSLGDFQNNVAETLEKPRNPGKLSMRKNRNLKV